MTGCNDGSNETHIAGSTCMANIHPPAPRTRPVSALAQHLIKLVMTSSQPTSRSHPPLAGTPLASGSREACMAKGWNDGNNAHRMPWLQTATLLWAGDCLWQGVRVKARAHSTAGCGAHGWWCCARSCVLSTPAVGSSSAWLPLLADVSNLIDYRGCHEREHSMYAPLRDWWSRRATHAEHPPAGPAPLTSTARPGWGAYSARTAWWA